MSNFASDLHRFGLDPEMQPDQAQWKNLCQLIRAIVNNPHLRIGTENSQTVMPEPPYLTYREDVRRGRFIITYSSVNERIYVSPGEVAFVEMCGSTDEQTIPVMPTLNGTPLDGPPPTDRPYWEVSAEGISVGTRYRVSVVLDSHAPYMEIGDAEAETPGSGTEYDTFVVGYIELKAAPPGSSGRLRVKKIEQKWESDIVWPKEQSSSSSQSLDGDSSSEEGGSDKSTAIVPAPWSRHGYAALFTMEAPEVLFEDVMVIPVHADSFAWPMDSRFKEVCERGTIKAVGITANAPALLGVKVEGGKLFVEVETYGKRRPSQVTVKLCGIRKGFAGMRFPDRDREQFLANEATLNAAYPAKDFD